MICGFYVTKKLFMKRLDGLYELHDGVAVGFRKVIESDG